MSYSLDKMPGMFEPQLETRTARAVLKHSLQYSQSCRTKLNYLNCGPFGDFLNYVFSSKIKQ